jgi:hypothetical protein
MVCNTVWRNWSFLPQNVINFVEVSECMPCFVQSEKWNKCYCCSVACNSLWHHPYTSIHSCSVTGNIMFGFYLMLQSYESTDSDTYIMGGTLCFLMCHCRQIHPMKILSIGLVRTNMYKRGCECHSNFHSVVDPGSFRGCALHFIPPKIPSRMPYDYSTVSRGTVL